MRDVHCLRSLSQCTISMSTGTRGPVRHVTDTESRFLNRTGFICALGGTEDTAQLYFVDIARRGMSAKGTCRANAGGKNRGPSLSLPPSLSLSQRHVLICGEKGRSSRILPSESSVPAEPASPPGELSPPLRHVRFPAGNNNIARPEEAQAARAGLTRRIWRRRGRGPRRAAHRSASASSTNRIPVRCSRTARCTPR